MLYVCSSWEVVLVPTEACLVHSEVLADGLEWMGWDGMVIIGQRSSKSTFGANNVNINRNGRYKAGPTTSLFSAEMLLRVCKNRS